jgi:hypothetical protein
VVHFWEHVYTLAHATLAGPDPTAAPPAGAVSAATWLETAALLWDSCQGALTKDKKQFKVSRHVCPKPACLRPWLTHVV